ncbi:MAG: nucleoside/nucleotide kinase family protein [Actinomycetota bacterium]|nr:nucleoside/nucleotide kinase family protein [Actinomycetota bacterium]
MKPVATDRALSVDEALTRARQYAAAGERRLIGICGPPGGGKSTLAERIVRDIGERARLVRMDGFHLAQKELARLGREDRKGAIDTFDGAGYVALLRRLRDAAEEVVYAPEFRREVEEPIAGAVAVPREVPLVVTEGNYLLVDREPWCDVRAVLDEVWFVVMAEETRLSWLIERHVRYGRSPEAARAWALGTDQRNARLIEATKTHADALVRVGA